MNESLNDSFCSNVTGVFAMSSKISWGKVFLGIFLFSNMLLTIVGNLLVLVAVYKEKSLQTAFNFFVVNLAITDVAVAATAMSFYATDKMLGYWPFGSFLCVTWILLDYGTTFASVFTLVAISSDRFWSVFWSINYRSVNKRKKSFLMLAAVWMTTFVLWIPPLVIDRINNPQPSDVCMWNPAQNRHFVLIIAIVGHHGPCLLMLFFYLFVFFYLRKRVKFGLMRSTQVGPTSKSMNDSSLSHNERKTSNASTNPTVEERRQKPRDPAYATANGRRSVSLKVLSVENLTKGQSCGQNDESRDYMTKEGSLLQVPAQTPNCKSDKKRSLSQSSNDERRTTREMRVFLTLTYIIVGYLVCWVPFHFVFDLTAIDPDLVPSFVYDVTFWLTYINSTINPFLYNFSSPDFRRAFRKIIFRSRSQSLNIGMVIQHTPSV